MRSARRVALATALAALMLAPASANETGEEDVDAPFTLAVVRLDGILTPFATWTGSTWENRWPVPEKEVDTPITLDEAPKRWWGKPGPTLAWHVRQVDGATNEARVTEPAWFPAHCQQAVGLRTSLTPRRPPPPPRVQPYPKLGVAASRPLDLHSIEAVDPASSFGTALVGSIRMQVNDEETRRAKQYQLEGWLHPYDDAARLEIPLRVEALYRAPADAAGAFTYYFEAVKHYPIRGRVGIERTVGAKATPLKPRTCEIVTFVSGWVTARPDAKDPKPSMLRTRLTSCDYESVDVMLPFAYVVLKGHPVWIAQLSGWGRERYVLLDPQSKHESDDVLFSTPGGFCPTGRG